MSREEERQYESDVFYEAYKRGIPESRLDYDRISDAYYRGQSADGYVDQLARAERRRAEEELAEQQYAEQAEWEAMQYEQEQEPPE